MKLYRITITLFTILLFSSYLLAQDLFVRSAQIPVPDNEPGGFGEVLSGLDLDGDGNLEIYAVNDNWNDTPDELIPRIYMYEQVGGVWTQQWMAVLGIPLQNTWPALATGDLDGDGKGEIIWGPVNNLGGGNTDPARLIVFEANGNDNELGVSDGAGNWLPNSAWNMDIPDNTNMRPFKWLVRDIDNDGVDEVVFADRAGSASLYKFGVASVDNIPDAGDGSETWTLEFAGTPAVPKFVRSAVLNADPAEPGGFGNIIAGVDFDGDGKKEIYAVNDNWNDGDYEVIPRLYKFEWNGAYWEIVWSTVLPGVPKQNTWPALDYADTDGDGKMEIFWGPVNFLTTDSQNPSRIVVYEAAGDGSDVMGVDDGSGVYAPNAQWSILDADGGNERPFRWHLHDIDGDGNLEVVYGARAGNLRFGIVSVDNIPDNGDGSETWTLEASGLDAGMTVDAGTIYDIAVIDNFAYLIHDSGNITPIAYEGGVYVSKPVLVAAAPGGSWNSSSVVDLDNDGQEEIIVGQWLGGAQVYLLQPNGDGLDLTVIGDFAALGSTRLNGGSSGDLDGDGNLDFVFGSRTTYAANDATIYRLSYNGGDITDPNNYSTSIIDHSLMPGGQWDVVACGDIDGDGRDEVLYSGVPRGAAAGLPIGVIDYSDGVIPGGSKWDIAIANGNVYTIDNDASFNKFQYINDEWQIAARLTGVAGGYGSFKGSVVADVDGDGVEEIIVGAWSSTAAGKVYLLSEINGGLSSTVIADLGPLGAVRLNGAAAGDIDGDGYVDFVFGSRGSGEGVFRVEYKGGDIYDPANYATSKIDEGVVVGDQLDIINIANVDDDADLEVIYSGIPRGGTAFPITILDIQKIETTAIADVKVDANGDFQPDNIGQVFTVVGVVVSTNFTASANRFSYYIQDATGGINITKGSETGGGPVYEVGKRLQATGTLGQFRGLAQLDIADLATDVIDLGSATVPTPVTLTIDQLLSDPETYEGMLVKFGVVIKAEGSPDWPAADADANMMITDGTGDLILRIDRDTDIDGQPEPTYPMSVKGVVTQYTSSSSVYDDGYQVSPSFYTDFVGGVPAPPSPYFYFTDATRSTYDGQTITIDDAAESFIFDWDPAVDLNGDPLIYQFIMIVGGVSKYLPAAGALNSPTITLTGQEIINTLGNVSQEVKLTMRAKGAEANLVSSVDTLTTSFDIVVSVDDETVIPKEFFVNQNYPNPFNPTTTIRFGLPKEAQVDVRIYDILGREVAVLVNNEVMSAGIHNFEFNASRLASGTYVYRVTTGDKVDVKKMLLLK